MLGPFSALESILPRRVRKPIECNFLDHEGYESKERVGPTSAFAKGVEKPKESNHQPHHAKSGEAW